MTVKEPGVTLDRKSASRAKLLAAARNLFVERGYHDTRPQDIAKSAGVGHGTFYLHFADKRACFLAFVEQAAAEINAYVAPYLESAHELKDILLNVLIAVRDYGESHPGVLAAAMSDMGVIDANSQAQSRNLIDLWAEGWAESLATLQASGQVEARYDPMIMGYVIVGTLYQGSVGAARAGRDEKALVDNVIPFLVEGLKPRTG